MMYHLHRLLLHRLYGIQRHRSAEMRRPMHLPNTSQQFWELSQEGWPAGAFTPNATSSAMLLSNNYTVLNSLGTNLSLLYSADIASSSLSSKIPYAYLALDIDPTLRGNFTNTIVFPIAGSSTPANTTLASNLIADGNWHRLSISLNSLLNYSTFEFR